jgi:GDPmannose 4,6-dehydratase
MYNAASSEMFGCSPPLQNIRTPFKPRSPYGVAKVAAYQNCVNYREGYGMFVSNGILFNHTSPRRGNTFVSKKITHGIVKIMKNLMLSINTKDDILLGNLDSSRDWGFAPEYVELMWKILQQPKPADYCIGSGTTITIKQFIEKAFTYVGFPIRWTGTALNRVGKIGGNKEVVHIDLKYYRPTEVEVLQCDNTQTRVALDWEQKISIDDIIKIMIDYDFMDSGLEPLGEGLEILKKKKFEWSMIR